MATEVKGDLLEFKATVIAHQCNCVTTKAKHLSEAVFQRFPHADIYSCRDDGPRNKPGTVVLKGDGKTEQYVANLLGQYYPGKSKYDNDSPEKRQGWFKKCMETLSTLPLLQDPTHSIAFPYTIGCGAAGGDWEVYEAMIQDLSTKIPAKVWIVKLPPAPPRKRKRDEPSAPTKPLQPEPEDLGNLARFF